MEASRSLKEYHEKYSERMKKLIDQMKIGNKERIIELGCANGFLTLNLASKFPDSEITAVDRSLEDLEELKEKAEKENLENILTYKSDATNLKMLEDNSVDLVVSNFFLSEIVSLSKLNSIFKEIYRVLKRKGITIHSELLKKGKTRAQNLLVIADTNYSRENVKWWKPDEIKRTMINAGLEEITTEHFNWNIDIRGRGIRELLRYWEIRDSFLRDYEKMIERYGLSLPKGYLITGRKLNPKKVDVKSV